MNVGSDVSEGLCNSFDTTVAFEDIEDYDDTDTDSGVHNNSTPDNIDNHMDVLDTTLETRTNDSLYESLKYQQGECFGSVITSLLQTASSSYLLTVTGLQTAVTASHFLTGYQSETEGR